MNFLFFRKISYWDYILLAILKYRDRRLFQKLLPEVFLCSGTKHLMVEPWIANISDQNVAYPCDKSYYMTVMKKDSSREISSAIENSELKEAIQSFLENLSIEDVKKYQTLAKEIKHWIKAVKGRNLDNEKNKQIIEKFKLLC